MRQWKSGNLIDKTRFSINGLVSAFVSENAIRRELGVLAALLLLSLYMGKGTKTTLAVLVAGLFPLVTELINTSAEMMIDTVLGPVYREDVRDAKDMLSAAVLLSLIIGDGAALLLIFSD